ncbi:Nif11-like leader peptide family natural product precursor [Synechococcus sp. UW105]|uniref:Nif11-like leader peptide family natural product precursor n=1 Tax=Synechococcus sp. UW105 TaxID=337067 RepID=UPI000E0FA748|nr:Nif11-like leader peptide family natural product precursor [Synechococcus sp. UW105]
MSDAQQDQILEDFITQARSDPSLRDEIKAALNQDEIISIAQARGFSVDSLAILRKWSKHTDFSKPTWLGWFDD